MIFENREHAGRLLAAKLEYLREGRPIVLGLTRGGIPVAFEVARELAVPLDLVVVRKLQASSAPESPVGAIAEGGATYVNPTVVSEARATRADLAALEEAEIAEVARRVRLYRGEVPAPRLHGRLVVVIDDFVTTGATVRAAARAARQRGAARVVLAVPVIAAAVTPWLRGELDEVVALEVAAPGRAPSESYAHLEEITDEDAIGYLRRARNEWIGEEIEEIEAPAAP